ncbi:hypothetical protein [Sulfurimonas sp.]
MDDVLSSDNVCKNIQNKKESRNTKRESMKKAKKHFNTLSKEEQEKIIKQFEKEKIT